MCILSYTTSKLLYDISLIRPPGFIYKGNNFITTILFSKSLGFLIDMQFFVKNCLKNSCNNGTYFLHFSVNTITVFGRI